MKFFKSKDPQPPTVDIPVLYKKAQNIIGDIEKKLDGKLICYWHSIYGSVYPSDVVAYSELLRSMGQSENIYLYIKSGGGDGQSSLRIVNLLHKYAKKLTVLIAGPCASAATMIALGAHEIRMGSLGYLTAVDTSLNHELAPVDSDDNPVTVSQDELTRVIKLWNDESKSTKKNVYHDLFNYVHPLVIGAADRSSSLSVRICKDILSFHMTDESRAISISNKLNSDYPSHSFPITLSEAKELGLNVLELDEDLNTLFSNLNTVYSEMCQRNTKNYKINHHHEMEVQTIVASQSMQLFYQTELDWRYRIFESRWVRHFDRSSWHKMITEGEEVKISKYFIR